MLGVETYFYFLPFCNIISPYSLNNCSIMAKNFYILLFVCFYAKLVNCQITFIPDQNFDLSLIDLNLDSGLSNGRIFPQRINTINELKVADLGISDLSGKEDTRNNECHDSYQNKNKSVRNLILDVVIEPQIREMNSFEDIQLVYAINSIQKKRKIEQVLSNLRDSINEHYGLYKGAPCVNSGPCGNFANLFYQKWNKRFDQKVSISFIMSADSSECYHVLIKLPNNDYYDGGNGILTKRYLIKGYEEGMYIIDMLEYDLELLDEKSYGLVREYPRCPNYSVDETAQIIDFHLDQLSIWLD